NKAFVDTRLIDGTPRRGNSGQDGNLLHNEAYVPVENNTYKINSYNLRNPIIPGKKYTIQIKAKFGRDRTSFLVYNTGGTFRETQVDKRFFDPETGIATVDFVAPMDKYNGYDRLNTRIDLYQYPNNGTSSTRIDWIKIEETTKENLVGSVKSMSPNNTGTGTITVNADGSVTNKADSGKV